MRDFDNYHTVVQALVDVGITRITDVESELSDYGAMRRKALAKALEDAREKASFLAHDMGVTLGGVHQIGDRQIDGDDDWLVEEILVSATYRDESILYEFQPRPVEISASVYVEFVIE